MCLFGEKKEYSSYGVHDYVLHDSPHPIPKRVWIVTSLVSSLRKSSRHYTGYYPDRCLSLHSIYRFHPPP